MNRHGDQLSQGPSSGMIILSAGMGSAGSGWYFNLTNDLLIASGERDVRQLRDELGLGDILFTKNCANDLRRKGDVDRLVAVAAMGNTFVVKSHKPPSRLFRRLQRTGRVKATYIYRDPRDVVVSVFERGAEARSRGRRSAFARFRTIGQVILWVRLRLLWVYSAWVRCPGTHIVRFEDLRADPLHEMRRLATFLGIEADEGAMQAIVDAYAGDGMQKKAGSHYRSGGGGRRRDKLSPRQLSLCNWLFAPYLRRMGYEGIEVGAADAAQRQQGAEISKGD
jgi:hypothetical protein